MRERVEHHRQGEREGLGDVPAVARRHPQGALAEGRARGVVGDDRDAPGTAVATHGRPHHGLRARIKGHATELRRNHLGDADGIWTSLSPRAAQVLEAGGRRRRGLLRVSETDDGQHRRRRPNRTDHTRHAAHNRA
jgi:hypothetical protein